jgi:hypothetical protein
MNVRVQVTDVWDTIEVPVTRDVTFADLKATCLDRATGRSLDPSNYAIKFRGALVIDEGQTLGAADVPDGAPMIVLPAHRQPVR